MANIDDDKAGVGEYVHTQLITNNWLDDDLRQAASALGPFSPPDDYSFGDEFISVSPRPIPNQLKQGTYSRRWRYMTILYFIIGVLCILLGMTNIIQKLAYYVLVLQLIIYIGLVFIFIVGVKILLQISTPGAFLYVRDGNPSIGRVLAIEKRFLHPGDEQKQFQIAVGVEYKHPEKSEMCYTTLLSDRVVPRGDPENYSTSLQIGDYVTVVGFSGRYEKTARLYGFLGLNPDQEFLIKNGKPFLSNPSSIALLYLALAICAILFMPLFIFVMDAYQPSSGPDTPWITGVIGGASLMCIVGVVLYRLYAKIPRHWSQYVTCGFCGLMFGGIAGLASTGMLNAFLDQSDPEYVEIEVVDFSQETWYPFFIRNYEIEFHRIPVGGTDTHISHPDEMNELAATYTGLAEYGEGLLGMRWIRAIHPTILIPVAAEDAKELTVITLEATDEDGETIKLALKPVVVLANGEVYKPSRKMIKRIRDLLAMDSNSLENR